MNAAISCKKKSWQLAGRKSQEVYLGVELKINSGMFGRNVPRYLRAYGGCHSAMVVCGAYESCVGVWQLCRGCGSCVGGVAAA